MPRSELYRRLKAVDPNLNIVPGGVRSHRRKANDNWERGAGQVCKSCGREYFRGRDGLCYQCWEKENEFEIRDKAGILNLLPKSVIMSIVHPARKKQE